MNVEMTVDSKQQPDVSKQVDSPVATRTRRLSRTNSQDSCDLKLTSSKGVTRLAAGKPSVTSDYQTRRGSQNNESTDGQNVYTVRDLVKILQKEESVRTLEDLKALEDWKFLLPEAQARIRDKLARKDMKQRTMEREESIESLELKADALAELIEEAQNIVIYTGAGISTSASIPDYRGPKGLWTQIKRKGYFSLTKYSDLSAAEPTFTHMAIKELVRRRFVRHVVSQNCDGLHLRSGIPVHQLSEIHGNMFIEICQFCQRQYYRQADVTDKTSRYKHKTGRKCHDCAEPNNNLYDTIVLFGERSRSKLPMNWERASKAVKNADLIICMGSSLKTLVRYNCLWSKRMKKSANNLEPETKLVIVNLQYTSKDDSAVLKISGKCDIVMKLVMQRLNIDVPRYDWSKDPLLQLAEPFTPEERLNLKRNLIFETREAQRAYKKGGHPLEIKRSISTSPSLFVSELTDDPDRKRLKMVIRAVNTDTLFDATTSRLNSDHKELRDATIDCENRIANIKREYVTRGDECINYQTVDINKKSQGLSPVEQLKFALPGWLGKSLGNRKTSSYRRKKHGNKGKRHGTRKATDTNTPPKESDETEEIIRGSSIDEEVMSEVKPVTLNDD